MVDSRSLRMAMALRGRILLQHLPERERIRLLSACDANSQLIIATWCGKLGNYFIDSKYDSIPRMIEGWWRR